MAAFGDELRGERERQGLTLETVSARTKVNPRHLEAIERGDFLALPGGVFRKGIVRAYLGALQLEEEAWLPRYQASWEAVSAQVGGDPLEARRAEQEAWATFATNVQRGRGGRPRGRSLRWLGVATLFLALAAAAWMLWRSLRQTPQRTGPVAALGRPRRPFLPLP